MTSFYFILFYLASPGYFLAGTPQQREPITAVPKIRPQHRELRALLFANSVLVL